MANTAAKATIWCLFSVDNNYDQPEHNLVAWWAKKPSLEKLFSTIGYELGEDDQVTVNLVNVWAGKPGQARGGDTSYSLKEVTEDEVLP